MDGLTESHRRELEELFRAYLAELTEKVGAMEAVVETLASGGWDRLTLEGLHDQAHRLAGCSGIYGLTAVTRAAGILEERVKTLLDGSPWPPAASPGELATVVKAVRQAARHDMRLARHRQGNP